MIRSGPQASWAHYQVAVLLDVDRDSPILLVRDRRSNCGRRTIPDTISTRATEELVMLGEIPQFQRPVLEEREIRHKRPVFVLDQRPQFRSHTGSADRTVVPAHNCLLRIPV